MKRIAFEILLFTWLAACSSSSVGAPVDPKAGDSTGDGGAPAIRQDCSGLGKSQSVSQACCLNDGVDACGAGLFCAAFDGRTQPTCYVEHSRTDAQSCTADVQCVSSSCNGAVGKCRAFPGTTCASDVGCANDREGQAYYCDSVCKARGFGLCENHCESDRDCQPGVGLHCDLTARTCAVAPQGSGLRCNADHTFNSCPNPSQKCIGYGECGLKSGSWTSKKACLDNAGCGADEICYHGGSIPCDVAVCQ
jgi:hypothetical protein